MTKVLPFPVQRVGRPVADAVRVGFDFGAWCVEVHSRDRLLHRLPAISEAAARARAAQLAGTGLRLLPDAPSSVTRWFDGDGDDCA